MNNLEFTTLLKEFNPNSFKLSDDLETITKIYPYFQTAHFLYVKSLQSQEKINFNSILEKTAAITYDRSLLMNWINEKYEINSNDFKIKNQEIIVKSLKNESLKKGRKAKFSDLKSKKLGFTEWISLSNNKQSNIIDFENSNSDDNWKIINSFLKKEPKISNPKNSTSNSIIDLSSKSDFSEEELMTETLAKIFIKQEKYDKAHHAYKILSLKYPEKNALFALQMSKIKLLVNKTNK